MPNKKDQWEIDFDGFKLEEYGKWKIGRVEAKDFIRQILAAKDQEIKQAKEEVVNYIKMRLEKAGDTTSEFYRNPLDFNEVFETILKNKGL